MTAYIRDWEHIINTFYNKLWMNNKITMHKILYNKASVHISIILLEL